MPPARELWNLWTPREIPRVVCCFDIEPPKLFVYFGDESLVDHIICKYFLRFCGRKLSFLFCLWFPLLCKKPLGLIRSHLFIFIFITLGGESKKILLQFMSKSVLPMFSFKSFIVSGLTFSFIIHF